MKPVVKSGGGGLNQNSHAKACWCSSCTKTKKVEFKQSYIERVRLMDIPRAPTSIEQLVPVRAHFRRQSNYLKKSPLLRAIAATYVKRILGEKDDE